MYPEKLEGVNVGDTVVITYAEALAMSVEKAPSRIILIPGPLQGRTTFKEE